MKTDSSANTILRTAGPDKKNRKTKRNCGFMKKF